MKEIIHGNLIDTYDYSAMIQNQSVRNISRVDSIFKEKTKTKVRTKKFENRKELKK